MQTALKRDAFSAIMPFKVTDFGTDRKLMFDFPSTLRPATSHCETRHIKYKICLLCGSPGRSNERLITSRTVRGHDAGVDD